MVEYGYASGETYQCRAERARRACHWRPILEGVSIGDIIMQIGGIKSKKGRA